MLNHNLFISGFQDASFNIPLLNPQLAYVNAEKENEIINTKLA